MLKLIVNNNHHSYGKTSPQDLGTKKLCSPIGSHQDSFLFNFRELSQNLYNFRARDFDLHLACDMSLEVCYSFAYSRGNCSEERYLVPIIVCDFPSIDVSQFNEKICWDEYLQGILMFKFQMRIFEKLLLFCKEKNTAHLILNFNKADIDYVEIYRRFLICEEHIISPKGEQARIVIPTDLETFDNTIDFIEEIEIDLRQTLWRNQKVNSVFRNYLMDHY